MSKEYEQIRVKISKQYKDKLNDLQYRNNQLIEQNESLLRENCELKAKLKHIEEELDAISKLVNMSEEERLNYIETEKNKSNLYQTMNILMNNMSYFNQ